MCCPYSRSTCAKDLEKQFGVHVGPAPRPTDVVWEHLHVDPVAQQWRIAYIVLVCVIMAPIIALTIIVATMFAQMVSMCDVRCKAHTFRVNASLVSLFTPRQCLFWVPVNMVISGDYWWQKAVGGLHWCWGILMFTLAYTTLGQLVALTLSQSEAGWVPAKYRPRVIKDW